MVQTNLWRTRVKVCGLTRPQDIDAAVRAGADAVGFVFYPASQRMLDVASARTLRQRVPAFVTVAALFVNAEPGDIRAVLDQVRPDVLQFHGDEQPRDCEQFDHPYIRAFRVGAPGMDTPEGLLAECHRYDLACGWLFDSYSAGYGGSGLAFDVDLLGGVQRTANGRPIILSGGLRPQTVGASIRAVRPYAVDVSSGVEDSPGIKSADRIAAFLEAVGKADEQASKGDNNN
ncbi:phosphoribosylanthranilate isomerase [Allopusillimonas soli]|uniref:N-(5'-phosphoribosyl)anthranilate isomerase n=1 Tax=Allopusillimonas soli TaxID=659016 RepID=A0A853FB89_9BURK|nr:phosphoribosylanthranilate isomerase [Allopusillimonas soli]NYT36892.1 phosphoribosylanthranilate isomerase [Allopusillimonas soli]TEA75350.1 phosphoribosylanthranilate isomerase [Allopusillimonas soli]